MPIRFKPLLLVCALLCGVGAAQAGSIDNVFVFGDSLSDTGNLAEAIAASQNLSGPSANFPDPPFFHDSVTNGPVAVELLAEHYGLRADPSLWVTGFADTQNLFGAGFKPGSNYAVAGAQAADSGTGIDLPQQIGAFSAKFGGNAPNDGLYVVFIGGNDVINAAQGNDTSLVAGGVASELAGIGALLQEGAQRLLVVNVANVGGTPAFAEQDPAQAGAATADSVLYNLLLAQGVDQLRQANQGAQIGLFDLFDFADQVAANAAALGITNTTDPCLDDSFSPNANCFDPLTQSILFDQFLFWDNIHPTAKIQAAWAQGLIVVAPEPATLALFALALGGLLLVRRRRPDRRAAGA